MRLWLRPQGYQILRLLLWWARAWRSRSGCRPAVAGPPRAAVDYDREIRPILAKNCFSCHGQDETHRAKGLRLDRRESAVTELPDGALAIVPGEPEASELIGRVTEEDESMRMPPRKSGNRLSPAEIDLLRRWIDEGASTPSTGPLSPRPTGRCPTVQRPVLAAQWDRFWILDRLEREGLKPSPEADRELLLRRRQPRPPRPSPDAGRDRRLRPRPGARRLREGRRPVPCRQPPTASAGRGSGSTWPATPIRPATARDPLRPTIWALSRLGHRRLQRNLPFDQFTIEQIAGDLLPARPATQRMATAFHRNTMTNTEGGTDDEEFRVAAVKDRVDTTGQVWMGLTIGCAKCHDHKYDPITQDEYYRLFAFFNQTADADQADESRPVSPRRRRPWRQQIRRIDEQIAG